MRIAYITTNEERYLASLLKEEFNVEIVITNNPKSKIIGFCRKRGINCCVIDNKKYSSRKEHDVAIMKKLDKISVDLVILAGYRRLIKSKEFLDKYGKKMINIHNSFLPNFPGIWPHKTAFFAGVKKSGYTIHYVDEVMDRGKIILQKEVNIERCKNSQQVYDKLVLAGCDGLLEIVSRFSNRKKLTRPLTHLKPSREIQL